jgi:dTDP-4-dehydrorhamnose 3,5-epimerase
MNSSKIEIIKTTLEGVLLFVPPEFKDLRGSFRETYNDEKYGEIFNTQGIEALKFIQDDVAISTKGVLRGIHGDEKSWKLTSCLQGEIYSAVVNCDESSENFGQWQGFILSGENGHQLLIPPKFGNSYVVLSDSVVYHYKQTTYYDPENNPQFTYRWNDKRFGITWPIQNPILSARDSFSE